MNKRILLIASTLALIGFFFIGNCRAEDPAGKKIFLDAKCNLCHTIEAENISKQGAGKGAADLSGVGLKHKTDWLTKYLQKKEQLNGKNHVKAFTGKEEDLKTLVTWLEGLKTEKKGQ